MKTAINIFNIGSYKLLVVVWTCVDFNLKESPSCWFVWPNLSHWRKTIRLILTSINFLSLSLSSKSNTQVNSWIRPVRTSIVLPLSLPLCLSNVKIFFLNDASNLATGVWVSTCQTCSSRNISTCWILFTHPQRPCRRTPNLMKRSNLMNSQRINV